MRTFQNFTSFRNHLYMYHSHDPSLCNDSEAEESGHTNHEVSTVDDDISDPIGANGELNDGDINYVSTVDNASALQRSSALLLMGLKERHKLIQVALQGVVQGVTSLVQSRMDLLYDHIRDQLTSAGVPMSTIDSLAPTFDEDGIFSRPFHGLETQHQQLTFYRENFSFIVSEMKLCMSCVINIPLYFTY